MFIEDLQNNFPKTGSIEVICGSMFSGKTEELIRRLKRAIIAQQKVEIFKPKVDVRYDVEKVVSHDANFIHSTPVASSKEILSLAKDVHAIGIDEAQFFDKDLPEVCNTLANKGVRVIVAGLDMDFKGNPFGPMPHLLAIAEYVTKVHAICVKTGQLANYSHRISIDENLLHLGEKESYEPLSRAAFLASKEKSKK
jgi:thymidine kinase